MGMTGKRGRRRTGRPKERVEPPFLVRKTLSTLPRPALPELALRAYRDVERMSILTLARVAARDEREWSAKEHAFLEGRHKLEQIVQGSKDVETVRSAMVQDAKAEAEHLVHVIFHTLYAFHIHRVHLAAGRQPPAVVQAEYARLAKECVDTLTKAEAAAEKKERLLRDRNALDQAVFETLKGRRPQRD